MAILIQDVNTWQSQHSYDKYQVCKPSILNDFYYRCTKSGMSGSLEPNWLNVLGATIKDNNAVWECINIISTQENSLLLYPEINRNQPLHQKVSEMINWVRSETEKDLQDIKNKYIDQFSLKDESLIELMNEVGYGYLAKANILNTENLATIFSYLKIINLLKGTRKGLHLVLDLLGYQYTESLWYEQPIPNEPHTYDLNLTLTIEQLNTLTLFSLFAFFERICLSISSTNNRSFTF